MRIKKYLKDFKYPGRIIVAGTTLSGALLYAYAIMGRSSNSRNRILKIEGKDLYTKPYDYSKIEDLTLIIYPAILNTEKEIIICNGTQSLNIKNALEQNLSMKEALENVTYEPDKPIFTPRISLVIKKDSFEFSILRKKENICEKAFFTYPKEKGVLYIIHTYENDESVTSFKGMPIKLEAEDNFAQKLWDNLDKENKISLYVKEEDKEFLFNAREMK